MPLAAAAVSLAAAAYSSRSWPIGVRRRVEGLQDRVDAAEAILEAQTAKIRAASVEQAEFMEAAEGVLQAVETKRRRIAARTSAEGRKNGEPQSPEEHRLALIKRAREMGHSV